MLSHILFSAAGGLAVYWSPPAARDRGAASRRPPTVDVKRIFYTFKGIILLFEHPATERLQLVSLN